MDPRRRLTYRFLSLPYHLRLAVAQELGLLTDEDKGVADGELFRRFLARARDRGQLDTLWRTVERHHGVADPGPSPFDRSA